MILRVFRSPDLTSMMIISHVPVFRGGGVHHPSLEENQKVSSPGSGFYPVSQLFAPGGQSIGTLASVSVLPMNIQD